jgi:crotonobetaine/carnitine-CoA ligase
MKVQSPTSQMCVLPSVLARWADEQADAVFAVLPGGETWTYGEFRTRVLARAAGLRRAGVQAKERVLSWGPNDGEALVTWFAVNELGACLVPVNTAYKGRLLEHVLRTSGAVRAVVHPALAVRLEGLDRADLQQVLLVGDPALDGEPVEVTAEVEPWDEYAVVYTSGTTGPSKGVLCSYSHLWHATDASIGRALTRNDRYMVNLPLFHAGGLMGVAGALHLGASIALVDGFDTSTFWDVVRRTGTTSCTLLGVMATFLAKQPKAEGERDSGLRHVFLVPLGLDSRDFAQRFGVTTQTLFNMTEVSSPLVSDVDPQMAGTCGRVRPGVQARLVDDHDVEVPVGQVGELVVRTDAPWAMSHGYLTMPEATAAAWRNGWFHTGDAFRQDAEGNFFFVDRIKDAIRRRGENISSFEVEAALTAHPQVLEAAVVAAPSEVGEDEVLAVVTPRPGAVLDLVALVEHCRDALPYFAVPRYVRVVDGLPKTPTNKVEKHLLRSQGVTPDTWDRVAAGIEVKRERITT